MRDRLQPARNKRASVRRAGFTLLEIVLALFILATMSALLVPSVASVIEKSRLASEHSALDELAGTITASFENTDLNSLNVAAFAGAIGASDTPTEFSTTTATASATTSSNVWFAKVARLRGITPNVGSAPTAAVQPALSQIVFNPLGNPRWLFAAPDESGRQRFLLISLMARGEQLPLPAYEANTGWFDAIWNHDWDNRTATPPSYWQSRLTASQLAAWRAGSGGMTSAYRLCVRRIVLPKYRVTVNNNHPTEQAFVSFNNTANAFAAPANAGATVTPEILGGRIITINRGTAWPGVEALRFHLRENATVSVQ